MEQADSFFFVHALIVGPPTHGDRRQPGDQGETEPQF